MTTHPDEGHTGLDRENNENPEVNREGKEAADGSAPHRGEDALEERMTELTEAAKNDDRH